MLIYQIVFGYWHCMNGDFTCSEADDYCAEEDDYCSEADDYCAQQGITCFNDDECASAISAWLQYDDNDSTYKITDSNCTGNTVGIFSKI